MNGSGVSVAARPGWISPQLLDRSEQVVIVLLWSLMAWRVTHSVNPVAPLLLLSESAVAFFVLIRRPTKNISMKLGDWLLAITATAAPLLIDPRDVADHGLVVPAVVLVALGTVLQAGAKLSLRRSFGIAPANRGIKIDGAYRLVRHPMYAGYLLCHIGILMGVFSFSNLALYIIAWIAQIRRLVAEEVLLSEDASYREYMEKVRWRLVPGLF